MAAPGAVAAKYPPVPGTPGSLRFQMRRIARLRMTVGLRLRVRVSWTVLRPPLWRSDRSRPPFEPLGLSNPVAKAGRSPHLTALISAKQPFLD